MVRLLILSQFIWFMYGCPMAVRQNVEEPTEITSQSVGVPGATCLYSSETILYSEAYFPKLMRPSLLNVLLVMKVVESGVAQTQETLKVFLVLEFLV